jgi:O-antigen/teichoic acid export membrane protein
MSVLSTGTQTGYFGVAFRILETATTIPPLLVSSALPVLARAARDDRARFDYAGRRLAETMVLSGVGLALVVFFGARFAVDLVAGAKFESSVGVLRILACALIGTFVISARGYALLSLGRLRAMLVSNAIALTVVFAAGIPLISAHGAKGGGIALLAAELTLACCYEIALTRGRSQLRPSLGFVARVVLAVAVAGAVTAVAGLPSLPAAVLAGAVYALAAIALRVVPAEVRHALLPRKAAS